jgi:Protein of unknown function (DUF3071)
VTELIFVGRSPEGENLVFMDEEGHEYHVAVDEHISRSIATPVRQESTSAVPLGVTPRDIQTRIRRGEAVSDIAADAGVDEDRILRFAGPVLSERAHLASRACATLVKRPQGDDTLRNLVVNKLEAHDIDCAQLEWDAWRREDTRWNVTVAWPAGSGSGYATWLFDAASQTVIAFDDEARWLFEDLSQSDKGEATRPRLVGLPIPSGDDVDDSDGELEPPAWAGPGHPTMPVPLSSSSTDDSPSWDDILFGHRPTDG